MYTSQTVSCASHVSLFCEIADSSILCISWVDLNNRWRSFGEVQDAVDHRGCRDAARRRHWFLRRQLESGWRISRLIFFSNSRSKFFLPALWEWSFAGFVVVVVVCLHEKKSSWNVTNWVKSVMYTVFWVLQKKHSWDARIKNFFSNWSLQPVNHVSLCLIYIFSIVIL